MDCREFLRGLSDFRDDLVRDHAALDRFEAHRLACPRCARLVAALDVGLSTLREPDEGGPSDTFRASLHRRLRAEVALGDPLMPTHAGLAAGLLMAAAVGLLLYEGLGRRATDELAARPAAVSTFPESTRVPPPLQDVTLPAFTHSEFEYHGQQEPLGTFAALMD